MFLVHRKGIVLDGSHPTLLFGYGASGTSTLPAYSPDVLTWLQLGGVFAVPTLRGGGEFGRDWYESATRERKQNTFDDFLRCTNSRRRDTGRVRCSGVHRKTTRDVAAAIVDGACRRRDMIHRTLRLCQHFLEVRYRARITALAEPEDGLTTDPCIEFSAGDCKQRCHTFAIRSL